MSQITENGIGSPLGTPLQELLMCEEIQPGAAPSYQTCKIIYEYHPLGKKIVDTPIKIAMSQARDITIPDAPPMVVEAFVREWQALKCNNVVYKLMALARIYGIGSVIVGAPEIDTDIEIDPWKWADYPIYFNTLDPLNTAGSLVLDQNPNSPTFQKYTNIAVSGQPYHRTRSCTIMNEAPIYISYTSSGFGFVGRSAYQRSLLPLKSFIQSMITDDMVTRKAGLLIAMLRNAGSIVNKVMQKVANIKRNLLKEAATNNVLSIEHDESIESIDLKNTDTAMTTARTNIIHNIASGSDMPAKMLLDESFAEGFGEGTEDAKHLVRYVNGVREDMEPIYEFLDPIVMHRAWSPEFFEAVQAEYPDLYAGKDYKATFYAWEKSFSALWPSLLEESDSEKSKLDKVKVEGLIEAATMLSASADQANKANIAQWVQDNLNEYNRLFPISLSLDIEGLASFEPASPMTGFVEDPE